MKDRQPCMHKQQRRLRHDDSVRSLRVVTDINKKSSGFMKGCQQSLIDWQHQTNRMNKNSNRRITKRQREDYGKISTTRLSNSNSNSNSKLYPIMINPSQHYEQYPTSSGYNYTTNKSDTMRQKLSPQYQLRQKLSPQQQLREQLQKQINQLYPVRHSFTNLSLYYQQLMSQYNTLLSEMHYINKMSQPSINIDRSQLLRQLQLQYQQKSDYLNIHLVPKLTQMKKENLVYCQLFNRLDQQLKQVRQLVRNGLLEKEILGQQWNKLNLQLGQESIIHQQSVSILSRLTKDLQHNKQIEQKYQSKLTTLKSQKQTKYLKQTQLLQTINQDKANNNTLITQLTSLRDKQKLAQQLNNQRLNRVNTKTLQLNSLRQKTSDLQTKSIILNKEHIELQVNLKSTQSILQQKQQQLQHLQQNQLPQSQHQYSQQKEQFIKNTKFLTYLKQYEKQLKQTSNIMFLKLNECCKQDYQKLIINKNKVIRDNDYINQMVKNQLVKDQSNNNVVSYDTLVQQDKLNSQQQSSQLNQLSHKFNNFKFDQQSVQKLIKQRAQLQQSNPYLNYS